jgi:hypothetical protein
MTEQNLLAQTLNIYASSWGPLTSDARMTAFATCLHEDFVYTDPNIRTAGYDELAAYMAGFQQQVPGGGRPTRNAESRPGRLLIDDHIG